MGAPGFDSSMMFYALVASATAMVVGTVLKELSDRRWVKNAGKALMVCGLPVALALAIPQARDACEHLPFDCGPLAKKSGSVIEAKIDPKIDPKSNRASSSARSEDDPAVGDTASREQAIELSPGKTEANQRQIAPSAPASAPQKVASASMSRTAQAASAPAKQEAKLEPKRSERRQSASAMLPVATHPATSVLGVAIGVASGGSGGTGSPSASNDLLVLGIKAELRRLGCYLGKPDGLWDKSVTTAINKFNAHGHRAIAGSPEEDSLTVLKAFQAPVCPIAASLE